jgi:recombination protein RecA
MSVALALPRLLLEVSTPPSPALPLIWPELEAALPDHGFPRGVVELTSSRALGGATSVALAAIRGAQARSPETWCAWLDPEGSLYAPGVAKMGVDLRQLLVVRPLRKDLGRIAVKLAQARAFDVIVLDYSTPALVQPVSSPVRLAGARKSARLRPEVLVRKLALLAEEGGSTILLLTDTTDPRPVPWPVALRLELSRAPGSLMVKVVKERFCRLGSARIAWPAPASAPAGT